MYCIWVIVEFGKLVEDDSLHFSVADPGFHRPGGGTAPKSEVEASKFFLKLLENDRMWTRGGGGVPGAP